MSTKFAKFDDEAPSADALESQRTTTSHHAVAARVSGFFLWAHTEEGGGFAVKWTPTIIVVVSTVLLIVFENIFLHTSIVSGWLTIFLVILFLVLAFVATRYGLWSRLWPRWEDMDDLHYWTAGTFFFVLLIAFGASLISAGSFGPFYLYGGITDGDSTLLSNCTREPTISEGTFELHGCMVDLTRAGWESSAVFGSYCVAPIVSSPQQTEIMYWATAIGCCEFAKFECDSWTHFNSSIASPQSADYGGAVKVSENRFSLQSSPSAVFLEYAEDANTSQIARLLTGNAPLIVFPILFFFFDVLLFWCCVHRRRQSA